jgi:hypothetical protein
VHVGCACIATLSGVLQMVMLAHWGIVSCYQHKCAVVPSMAWWLCDLVGLGLVSWTGVVASFGSAFQPAVGACCAYVFDCFQG